MQQHGGLHGIRDPGLLESALDRPKNRYHYESDVDLADLAASYGLGLAKNHAFVDGNKRTAFQVMYTFLGLNGVRLPAPEATVVTLMVEVATGEVDETLLAAWCRDHLTPRQGGKVTGLSRGRLG